MTARLHVWNKQAIMTSGTSVPNVLRPGVHRHRPARLALIDAWRRHYNTQRPHSSLNYCPPAPKAILPAAFMPPYYVEAAA